MEQPTFSDLEYQGKKRKTRREQFLERMDSLIPWYSKKCLKSHPPIRYGAPTHPDYCAATRSRLSASNRSRISCSPRSAGHP